MSNVHLDAKKKRRISLNNPPRNRLSPRFINKAKRPNRYTVMRNSSYKQIKDKQQKLRSNELATEGAVSLGRPELHDNAPKEVTTQQAPPSPRPQRSRVFTRSSNVERVATTMPSRGSRHPQASPSLAPERWDFAQKNPITPGTLDY
jgi:hypothetical protein